MTYYPKTPYSQLSTIIHRSASSYDGMGDLVVAIIERAALDAAGFVSAPIPSGTNRDEMQAESITWMGSTRFASMCAVVGLDPRRVQRWAQQSNSIRKMHKRGEMRTHENTRAWGERLVADDDPFGEALVEIADAWAVDREKRAAEVVRSTLKDLAREMMDSSDDRDKTVEADALAQASRYIASYAERI
jgi:hypothetical protein